MAHPEKRDLELTQKQLYAWLAGKFTDARNLGITVHGEPSSSGFSSDTILFDAD
jgi:hypothetical protein